MIGCGKVMQHYEKLLDSVSDINIDSLYDLNPNILDKYDKKYKKCTDLKKLFDSKPDLICILSPSGDHFETSKKCIENNFHILVEKPLCLTPSECEILLNLSLKHKTKIYCAFQNRFNDAVQKAKELLEGNFIGSIISTHISLDWCRTQEYYNNNWHGKWSSDGGVIAQQAIHHLDAFVYLLGYPEKVIGLGKNVINKLEAEDTFTALLDIDSFITATFNASTAFRPRDKSAEISIKGTEGEINIGGIALNEITYFKNDEQEFKLSEDFKNGFGLSHLKLLTAIKNEINKKEYGKDKALDINLAIKTTNLVSALYHSWEEGVWSQPGKSISKKLGIIN